MGLSTPHPATISDCAALATLHHAAYTAAKYRLYMYLWGKCAEEEIWRFHAEVFESAIAAARRSRGGRGRIVVVREGGADGEIVSYALWNRPCGGGAAGGEEEGGEAVEDCEWKYMRGDAVPSFPEGYNAELAKRKNEETVRRMGSLPGGGDGMWHLSWLGTKPGYQGQGAAQRVMKWGFDQADEEGRMCYVSTDLDSPAYKLYEKMGFKVTGPMTEFDFENFGGEGRLRYVTLVREPGGEKV